MQLLMIAMLVLSASPARAAFEIGHTSARPSGISGAYTAVADDVQSLFLNPAGLKEITHPELSMQYGHIVGGLSDGSQFNQGILAFAQPLRGYGVAAFGYTTLRLNGLYEERTISLGYGRGFWDNRLGLGATLKHLHVGFGSDGYNDNAVDNSGNVQQGASDPTLSGGAGASAVGFDFGLLYQLTQRVRLGFSALNINQPSVGITESSPVTRTLAWGLAGKLGSGTLSADLSRREVLDGYTDTVAAVGYEFQKSYQKNIFFMRGGGRLASRNQKQLNIGLGWGIAGLQIDYAVTLPFSEIQTSNNSHQASLTYRFGENK